MLFRPFVLLSFKAPEYEMDATRGIVRWRIEKGVLVSKAGRGRGYLEIDVQRHPPGPDGRAILHVEVEVANFYPSLASGIGNWFYANTQSRIHVIVTHGFLRSLARLDLAESRVGRFATVDGGAGPADAAARAGQRRLSTRHATSSRCGRPVAERRQARPHPIRQLLRAAGRLGERREQALASEALAVGAHRVGHAVRVEHERLPRLERDALGRPVAGLGQRAGQRADRGDLARARPADMWIGGGWPAESTWATAPRSWTRATLQVSRSGPPRSRRSS